MAETGLELDTTTRTALWRQLATAIDAYAAEVADLRVTPAFRVWVAVQLVVTQRKSRTCA